MIQCCQLRLSAIGHLNLRLIFNVLIVRHGGSS